MNARTTPELVCLQGHRWRIPDHPDDESPNCPTCGEGALNGDGDSLPSQPPADRSHSASATAPFPTIPSYTIRNVLGQGRAGQVYETREPARDRLISLEMADLPQGGNTGHKTLVQFDPSATRL